MINNPVSLSEIESQFGKRLNTWLQDIKKLEDEVSIFPHGGPWHTKHRTVKKLQWIIFEEAHRIFKCGDTLQTSQNFYYRRE